MNPDRYTLSTTASLAYWRGLFGHGLPADTCQLGTLLVLLGIFAFLFFPWFLPRSVWAALRAAP